uniref:DUF7044 domain-containing protein n=1 Tax=Timema cristinae TaxID=61476 RepID=A0A7R9H111_TIMCR|nr:unnamed protein product [Timema cristinae]
MFVSVDWTSLSPSPGKASCYFSIELQGEFVMQSTVNPIGSRVQYSHVNITADSIPIWGHCHRRIGNNVILMDRYSGEMKAHLGLVTVSLTILDSLVSTIELRVVGTRNEP